MANMYMKVLTKIEVLTCSGPVVQVGNDRLYFYEDFWPFGLNLLFFWLI